MRALLNKPIVFLTLLGVILLLPSFLAGPGATHSYHYNYMWTAHFGTQIAAGHPYERWIAGSFEGLGSPTFYFYPPLAYLVTGAFHALGLTVFQAINMGSLALLVASGLAMHRWLEDRGTHPLLGAAIYMAAPYHLYDFYVRGALAEFGAFVWLPLIALGIRRLPARRGVLLLAFSFAGLILTHLPLAMLTGIFLIAPLMLHHMWSNRRVILPGALAGLLALALTAFYLLPALTLQDQVSMSMLWTDHYLATSYSIWQTAPIFYPCMALGLVLLAWPARSIWAVVAVVTALASVRLIPFLWDIALLNKAQFPWRALCIAEFAAVTALMSYRPRRATLVAGGLALAIPLAAMAIVANINLRTAVDYGRIARAAPDPAEYLPAGFDLAKVDELGRWTDVSAYRSLCRTDTMRIDRAGPAAFGRSAFPIWQVTRNGLPIASAGPVIRFSATPGIYKIERVLIWQEIWGAAISLIALLCVVATSMRLRTGISHLSKFPAYSPSLSTLGWRIFGWPGRPRESGGGT
ncbi:MAG: integral membrane-like protein [Sphingobium sp.]